MVENSNLLTLMWVILLLHLNIYSSSHNSTLILIFLYFCLSVSLFMSSQKLFVSDGNCSIILTSEFSLFVTVALGLHSTFFTLCGVHMALGLASKTSLSEFSASLLLMILPFSSHTSISSPTLIAP